MSERLWLCRCDCGREVYVREDCLLDGRITNCGECEADDGRLLPIMNSRSPQERPQ